MSLHAIRDNFNKSDRVAADDRYVRDFDQFEDDEDWDLESYRGQAYGLQYKIFQDGYSGGSSGLGQLPKSETDRRYDGMLTEVGSISKWGSYALVGKDDQGKYAQIRAYQTYGMSNPGSMQLNGIWFANEAGPGAQYRLRATVETSSDFAANAEAGVYVFGYRYGYLDGDRKTYSLWGYGENPGPNQTLTINETFTVSDDHRHIVVNMSCWLPGRYGDYDRAEIKIRDLTIERV